MLNTKPVQIDVIGTFWREMKEELFNSEKQMAFFISGRST